MRKLAGVALVCIIVLAAQTLLVREARANGAPIKVVLTYLPGVSNWGPTGASGVAEVVKKEGIVRLNVVGLPQQEDLVYWAWLINTANQESLSVGSFNASKTGVVAQEFVLSAEIPDTGWNLILVTVEDKSQAAQAPGSRKSIGGYFPDSAEGRQLPSQLPRTGGETEPAITVVPQVQSQTPAKTGAKPAVFDELTFGAVGLAAIFVGVLTASKMRGKQTRRPR